MPANTFEWDGWQGHYRRVLRWFERFVTVANNWDLHSMEEQIDYAFAFFQSAYHLRDWLLHEGAVERRAIDELMRQSRPLQICRDLANGSKHRILTAASVDAEPWILRTLNFGGTPRLTLKADPELVDLVTVASECVGAWDGFLRENGLDPLALSAPAQALTNALYQRGQHSDRSHAPEGCDRAAGLTQPAQSPRRTSRLSVPGSRAGRTTRAGRRL